MIESLWTILPLPKGEGRGEGESSVAHPKGPISNVELSRFTEWRVGVGFAHRGEFTASLRLLCFLLFRPEWLTLQSVRLRDDPSATRSR